MKSLHLKTARGHFGFAAWYGLLLLAALPLPNWTAIDWTVVGLLAAPVLLHIVLACGALRACRWARSLTLLMCYPLLIVIPLGTLAAIPMISYCRPEWPKRAR